MEIQFEEMKKIYDAVKNASELFSIKSFKPWESKNNKEYITIVLSKKE